MAEKTLRIAYSIDQLQAVARQLLQAANGSRIFAFNGDLGAGKTTLINALCRELGVSDHVSSPTFSLINEYRFVKDGQEKIIYHMDWYRLRDAEEAINAGMEDCLIRPEVYCFIEWPERASELLTMSHCTVDIEHTGDDTRELTASIR